MNAYDFEGVCLVTKAAVWELDEAARWSSFDPDRMERAKRRATIEIAALVAAVREMTT